MRSQLSCYATESSLFPPLSFRVSSKFVLGETEGKLVDGWSIVSSTRESSVNGFCLTDY